MSDESVQVTFGGDASGVQQASKDASSAVQGAADAINAQSAALKDNAAQASSVGSALASVSVASVASSQAIAQVGNAAVAAGHGTAGFYRELIVLGHEMLNGNYTRFGGSMMVLAERSGQLTNAVSVLRAATNPLTVTIGVVIAGLAAWAIQAEEVARQMDNIRVQTTFNGTTSLFDPTQIRAYSTALSELSGISGKDAREAEEALASSARITRQEFQQANAILPDLAAKMGTATKAADFLAKAIDDPAVAFRALKPAIEENDPALAQAIEGFIRLGDNASATRAILDYLTTSAKGLHDIGMTPLDEVVQFLKQHWTELLEKLSAAVGVFSTLSQMARTLAADLKGVTLADMARGDMLSKISENSRIRNEGAITGSGQTYNMDAARIEMRRQLNEEIARGDLLEKEANTDADKRRELEEKILALRQAQNAAQAEGLKDKVADYGAAISKYQEDLANVGKKQSTREDHEQLEGWEADLTKQLRDLQLFGDQAKAFEEKYWADKLSKATAGSAEYNQILSKVYNLQSELAQKSAEAAKESDRKKAEEQKKAYDAETASILKSYDEDAALYQKDFANWLKIQTQKLAVIKALYGAQSSQAEQQQARINEAEGQQIQKLETRWQGFFNNFNSGIKGLISGTQSFHQAFLNSLDNLGNSFVLAVEKMAAHWIATELVKTAATEAGNAARTTSDAAAATASGGFSGAKVIKEIEGDAARTYSGVFGFLAPEMGPLAAVPAGAAAALVVGMEAMVPSFDVGAYKLNSDTLAMVHKGETIMPARAAEAWRQGQEGGGGSTSITINAVDAKSIHDLIAGNPDAIAAGLNRAVRNGNRNLRSMMR